MHKKINREIVSVFLLLFSLIVVRLVNINELFHFTYDESVFAFIGRRMFMGNHIPLIGGVTPFHVHLAPYFYWFSGILLRLFQFNPLGWGVFTAFFSVVSGFLIYKFVSFTFSKRAAFYSLFLYTFSLSVIIFDRHYWGIFFNPFLSIVVIISLYKIVQKKYIYYISLFSALAFGFHTDPSTVILIFVSIIVLFYYKTSISRNALFYLGFSIFILSFIPLLIFDIKHNFVNISAVGEYVSETKETTGFDIERLANSLFILPQFNARLLYISGQVDFAQEYSYCEEFSEARFLKLPLLLIVLCVIIYYLFFVRFRFESESQKQPRLIFLSFIISVALGVILYRGVLGRLFFDHYLTTLIPVFIIIFGVTLDKLIGNKRFLAFLVLSLFLIINLNGLKNSFHSYSYKNKISAVEWVITNVSSEFSLDSLSSCFTYNGYRYLFTMKGKEPSKSYVDQNFFWLYDRYPAYEHPNKVVIFVAPDYIKDNNLVTRYNEYKRNEIVSHKFGVLEVIIADNTGEIIYDF